MGIRTIVSTATLLAGLALHPAAEAQNPIEIEVLALHSGFTDDVSIQIRNKFVGRKTDALNLKDGGNMVTARVTIQPGAVFPWHTHPGPVLISVVSGDFVYTLAEDCIDRWYAEGSALIDAGFGNIHSAYNPSETVVTEVIATFLGVPDGAPVTVLAEGPDPDVCPLPSP